MAKKTTPVSKKLYIEALERPALAKDCACPPQQATTLAIGEESAKGK